jgi:tellurite resistance protein TerC
MDTLPLWAWGGFIAFIVAMLALDLGVFHRQSHEVKMKEALAWCAVWVALALAFNGLVWHWRGPRAGLEFFTGYLVELCLSVDNVFVFILLFTYFQVPPRHQHRVLFWGIVGAALMRAVFIFAGIALLQKFTFLIYAFGAFLVFTGIKMFRPKGEAQVQPEKNPVVKLFRRYFPVSPAYEEGRFLTHFGGRRMATPLFIVLIVVETTDLAFAVDSIPAVLAITRDSFVVFTSNIFAILGLRALYFAVAGVMKLFRFLSTGLAIILVFIGLKMLAQHWLDLPIGLSLGVIGVVLTVSVAASLLFPENPAPLKRD